MPRYRSQELMTGGVIASATAPVAHVGQRWFNTATAVTYQYTRDAAGTKFWLDISSGGIGTSAGRGVDFVGDTDPHLESAVTGDGLAVGSVYYNREADRYFVCTTATNSANVWAGRYAGSGGIETTYKSGSDFYRVHTFLSSGTFYMDSTTSVDYLVVAGGGSGGSRIGGGGGAGGFRTGASLSTSVGSYAITVGAGGLGVYWTAGVGAVGNDGGDSIFSTITSTGGGGGGSYGEPSGLAGRAGGSGGGGGTASAAGGAGNTPSTSPVQGYAGGAGMAHSSPYSAGGGGGASAVGTAGSTNGGVGGAGIDNSYRTNSTVTYAGGGGGNSYAANGGAGGTGGGGAGGTGPSGAAGIGAKNTGGGGGGTEDNGGVSGAGGSGIVVIRYQLNA